MEIIRLEDENSPYFESIYDWNYAWWGVRDEISPAEVRCTLAHSLNRGFSVSVSKGRYHS